ncbi:MAG TPA: NADP-dependent glyceraldehyde-3-phosphate dehydrogenase, partial [Thermodesulfovibrionales bacterium]|nr:NADP-dependent glyceraldehyde-3-phosphate dehydrogenase [Thermodesulfovibrionales bacterium]
LVGGELRVWNGRMYDVSSPIYVQTPKGLAQKTLGRFPMMSGRESLRALQAALDAYDSGRGMWPGMSMRERICCVEKFMGRMKERKKDILLLMMWEIGKSYCEAQKEFDRTIGYIENTLEAVEDISRASSGFVTEQGIMGQIRRSPLGVVLCMGPFNYPLNETFATLIPALLMGNTAIFKPPKLGVLLHYPLLGALRDSFPPGVVNTVYGDGKQVITPLMESGRVDVLAFIGSSRTADVIKSRHPRPQRLKSVLGLEAKNPAVVLGDADLDNAVKECVAGSLAFSGQRCTALKIIFVHSAIAERFIDRFVGAVRSLKVGMPWEKEVTITPLPEKGRTDYLMGLLNDSLAHGARIMNELGGRVNKTIFYPTVVYPVSSKARLYREEQFGPLVPIVAFEDIETPVRYIIDSSYGQQASIFGRDPGVLGDLANVFVKQVCRVNINSMCQRGPDIFPFAGRKDSGEGTLSVSDALRIFSMRTIVATKEKEKNRQIFVKVVGKNK